jgi:hypothetical protein
MTELEMKEAKELIRSFVDRVEKGEIKPTPDYKKACRLLHRNPIDENMLIEIRCHYIQNIL